MPRFSSYDGTALAYRVVGDGEPLVCLPGGAGRAVSYLGELGGLSAHRALVLLDNRGTGSSDEPADPSTYRRDRLALDVEALRQHLGLERLDLLGHSAGAGIAMAYAEHFPHHLSSLVLLTPALRAAGLSPTEEDWADHLAVHAHQPWHADAVRALRAWSAGDDSLTNRLAAAPLFYGSWTPAAQAHAAAEDAERSKEAQQGYWAEGAFSPGHTRRALADLAIPVLVYAGGVDPVSPPHLVRQLAELIPGAEYTEQPGAGHFPWIDDPEFLVKRLAAFLT
ncbi:alpha/beta fold hydrolase [Saccharothrix variisporea]|nr:alpha/beta hydrolase [Saccharothrix variisporea]